MLEPTWGPMAPSYLRSERPGSTLRRRASVRVRQRRVAVAARQRVGPLEVAPFAIPLVWALVTATALLIGMATGRHELLDACRSDAALTSTAALTALALLAASARRLRD